MKDEELERIALLTIIAGLILALIFVLDFEPVDTHYLTQEDNNAYLEGIITRKSYNEESGWTYLEIYTCKNTVSFYEGEITKNTNDTIYIKGTYQDNKFSIKNYK